METKKKWSFPKYFSHLFGSGSKRIHRTIQCGFCEKISRLPRGTQFGGFICYTCKCGHVMLTADQALRLLRDFVLELEPLIETHCDRDLPFEKCTVVESFFTSTFQLLLNGIPALKASFKGGTTNRKKKKSRLKKSKNSKHSKHSKHEKEKKNRYYSGAGFLVFCYNVNQMFTCLKPFMKQLDEHWAAALSALNSTINLLPGPAYDLCRRVRTAQKTFLCLVRTDEEEDASGSDGSFQRTFSFSVNDRQDFSKSDTEKFDIPRSQSDFPRTGSSIRPLPRHAKRRRRPLGAQRQSKIPPIPPFGNQHTGYISDSSIPSSISTTSTTPSTTTSISISQPKPHVQSRKLPTYLNHHSSSSDNHTNNNNKNQISVSSTWMRDDILDSKFFESERKRDRTREIENERLKHSLPVHVSIKTFKMQKSQQQKNLPPISISLRASPSVSILTTTTHSTLSSHTTKPGVLATKLPLDPSYDLQNPFPRVPSFPSATHAPAIQKNFYSFPTHQTPLLTTTHTLTTSTTSSTSSAPLIPTFPTYPKQQLIKTRTLPSSHYSKFPLRPLSPSPLDGFYGSNNSGNNGDVKNNKNVTNENKMIGGVGGNHYGTTSMVVESRLIKGAQQESRWGLGESRLTELGMDYGNTMDGLGMEKRPIDRRLSHSVDGVPVSVVGMGQKQETDGSSNPFLIADRDNEEEKKRIEEETTMIMNMIKSQKERREREERERIEKERRAREYAEAQRAQEERQKFREEREKIRLEREKRLQEEEQKKRRERHEQAIKKYQAFENHIQEKLMSWVETEREQQAHAPPNWLASSEYSGMNF